MKLTVKQIDSSKPKEKDYKLSDGGGLYLLVKTNGGKYWRLKYRIDGKEKLLAIGVYPTVTLADARRKRDDAKRLLADGIDPNQQRKEQKQASKIDSVNTFKNIALEWYEGRKDRWSVGYRDDMMDAFEKDVFPYIGNRPIAEIKPMELLEVLSIMEKRGATEKLKKVRQRCGEVWKYAIITGRAEYNPAPDLASAFVPHKREHYAHLSVSELPDFLSSIDKYMGSQIVRVALRVLILTGVRPGELRKAEWSEINFDTKIWEIPAEKMKMRRPHIVPLSEQVIDLLRQIHPISGSYQYIFPSRTDYRKHISDMALNTMIRRMGYSGRATGHGFRHTMSTILHEQGYNTAWIETQLAHVDKNSIRGTYNHAQYIDGRREMLQWYADYMGALENGDNVVHGNFKRA
ncbi:tyrosine-type recombinase/integrase [Providencia stuartii]|uniref:CPS-53 (KpLE1) prophage, Sf6-like integrase n=1 Tax=Providencia stuartii (strain MRSN 2154) TaxID=1157951 RepID=A0A140NTK4_PROSM|nr:MULTISPECIES: integrase arm-type DNA-binding domain-containing protein [Providencia]AFH95282.1 CPS-53 (KpLE1) prophage, Sf6-like integrase [Providencia stuartii MRSN 2154]AVE42841.1 integrase [Providencia stuartii]MDE8745682.1 tyrosine-type recombinase/integrase [Providencia thailandensis]MDE8764357.1 tyrosine-type recombinase/integrase [Providencia thailandensis]MDE8776589.1 tyrosine-type recombinase/integrase [Providencia thailandensis]